MSAARAAVAALGVIVLAGCTPPSITRPDVTGGRRLELFVSSAGDRVERYRVGTDGVLHWAGGANAVSGKFAWSGPLTDDERERLFDVIEQAGWVDRDPPSTEVPLDTIFSVEVRGPGGRNAFRVTGETEALVQVHDLLAQASRRRLEADLQALPPPGSRSR